MDEFARRISLETFEKNINYKFNNIALLEEALTHTSYAHEHKKNYNYERMEVLGDSLLGFIVIDYIFKNHKELSEGNISKIKSFVVSEPVLAKASTRIGVSEYMQLGRGEEQNGGRQKASILADIFEAIVCAIYLDSKKMEPAYDFVIHNIGPEITNSSLSDQYDANNYKSMLQEYAVKMYGIKPQYRLIKSLGPDHDKTFIIAVEINGVDFGQGMAKSRKDAEQLAAQMAHNRIIDLLAEEKSGKK